MRCSCEYGHVHAELSLTMGRRCQERAHRLVLECIAEWSSRHARDMPQAALAAQALANDKHIEFPTPSTAATGREVSGSAAREGDEARRRRLLALESQLQVRPSPRAPLRPK